jgi:hypothetical protein
MSTNRAGGQHHASAMEFHRGNERSSNSVKNIDSDYFDEI